MGKRTNRCSLVVVTGVTAVLVLTGCTAKRTVAAAPSVTPAGSSAASPDVSSPAPTPAIEPAALSILPAANAAGVSPLTPVKIDVNGGVLAAVSVRSQAGTPVKGAMTADKTAWVSNEPLGYSARYLVTASATNSEGAKVSKTSQFDTVAVTTDNQTMAYINTGAGQQITPGVTYGVGQVVKFHFDEAITNRKAAQAALSVTTSPAQVGGFNWFDNSNVYWRSKTYLKTGTKVTIATHIYGKNFGTATKSLYGQADSSTWFKVGAKQISIADDNTKLIKVYRNDKLVRTIPTSMGAHTSIAGDHAPIDRRTNSGVHVVIGTERNINMNSCTFGLCKGANAYKTIVPIGVKISYDGEYVHWADWSIWAQGNTDTSHGCLNVSPANSYWFADFSQPGDLVDVQNTGRPLALSNSGYWTESWKAWLAGGA